MSLIEAFWKHPWRIQTLRCPPALPWKQRMWERDMGHAHPDRPSVFYIWSCSCPTLQAATPQMDSLNLPTYPFLKEGSNNLRAVEAKGKGWRLFGTFPLQERDVATFHLCNGGIAPLLPFMAGIWGGAEPVFSQPFSLAHGCGAGPSAPALLG